MEPQDMQALLFDLLPSPIYLAGTILFGIIGFIAYRYGKKTDRTITRYTGIALIFYPYLTGSDTRLLYLVGTGLCVVLYMFHDK